jgi:hypothetical protein
VIILLLLMFIPLPLPYNATLQTNILNLAHSQIGSTDSISVSGSWSTTDGGSVTFTIVSANGSTAYTADASSGSFSFGETDPPYTVGVYALLPETVTISGISWGPLIPIGVP